MNQGSFWARRVHSLSGVVPIGAFIIEHFFGNSYSAHGPAAYNGYVATLQSLPYVLWMEVLFIGLPIAFHGIYGAYIAFQAKVNVGSYSYGRNWMFTLQRVSGVFLVLYIGWHVWETRIAVALDPALKHDLFSHMQGIFENPLMVAFYVAGVAAAAFHFANGLWTFLIVWGVTVGPRGQRISSMACAGLGIVLFLMGVNSIRGFFDHLPVAV